METAGYSLLSKFSDNLNRGFDYISRFSIYPYIVRNDYNSAQCCLATLFYFLTIGNVEGFLLTKVLSEQLEQMRSAYMKIWLLEDFQFSRKDVMRALITLSSMVANQHLTSNSRIVDIIIGLEKKYDLEGYFIEMVMTERSSKYRNSVTTKYNDKEERTSDDLTTSLNLKPVITTSIATQTIVKAPLMKVDSDTLLTAVKRNNKKYVNYLLSEDVSDEDKGLSLLEAVAGDYSEIVRMLVFSGADVGYKGRDERTSLHLAAVKGKLDCVRELLEADGICVEMRGPYDTTALHEASMTGHMEIVELLLAKGACVDSRDRVNDTPLHYAAYHERSDVAQLLVSSGAKINVMNTKNQTPLDYAKGRNNRTITNFLIYEGAIE